MLVNLTLGMIFNMSDLKPNSFNDYNLNYKLRQPIGRSVHSGRFLRLLLPPLNISVYSLLYRYMIKYNNRKEYQYFYSKKKISADIV